MIDVNAPKAIIHNLTFKGIEVVPGVLNFDQRGIVYAKGGDVVVTKTPPDPHFLENLKQLGWSFEGVDFISPTATKNYKYNSIFRDRTVISFLKKKPRRYLDTYNNTDEEDNFSQKLRIPIYADCKVGQKYGTKTGFRKLARSLGLLIPRGFENINTTAQALKSITDLFTEGISEVVIKLDEGISGAGSTKIKKEDFEKWARSKQEEIISKALTKVAQAQKTSGAVVEEWLSEAIASPSVQPQILPGKRIKIVSMHDQLLEGEEKWYVGCVYPVNSIGEEVINRLKTEALKFTEELAKKGFVGFLGLDAVVTKRGGPYWVEANVRKPGTFYPRVIAEHLNGGSLSGVFYIASDFTVSQLKGRTFKTIRNLFKNWLYPISGKKKGVVLYNVGALREAGRFDAVCLGSSASEADEVYSKVKKKIDKLKS